MPQARQVTYPLRGLVKGFAFTVQPELTSPDALNENSIGSIEGRARGGQRDGTSKWFASTINGANQIQNLSVIVTGIAVAES